MKRGSKLPIIASNKKFSVYQFIKLKLFFYISMENSWGSYAVTKFTLSTSSLIPPYYPMNGTNLKKCSSPKMSNLTYFLLDLLHTKILVESNLE